MRPPSFGSARFKASISSIVGSAWLMGDMLPQTAGRVQTGSSTVIWNACLSRRFLQLDLLPFQLVRAVVAEFNHAALNVIMAMRDLLIRVGLNMVMPHRRVQSWQFKVAVPIPSLCRNAVELLAAGAVIPNPLLAAVRSNRDFVHISPLDYSSVIKAFP